MWHKTGPYGQRGFTPHILRGGALIVVTKKTSYLSEF